MNTQLCLLSGEVIPNVIGVLHTRSDHLLPVVTRESETQLRALTAALRAADWPGFIMDPIEVLPWDLKDCLATLRQKLEPHRNGSLLINWTGGTKVMSYAARRLAEELRLPALYINTAQRQILLEFPDEDQPRTELIDAARLHLNPLVHILAAGHTVEAADTLESFRQRTTPDPALVRAATLILDARPFEQNDLRRLAEAINRPCTPTRLGDEFLRALQDAQLIQPGRRPGEFFLSPNTLLHPFHLQSPQEQNAAFLRSLYLEVFLWSQIRERSALDDVAWHVVLNPGQKGRMAELDIVASHEGRILVLECKAAIDLHRLSDLIEEQYARSRRIGRLFAHWMLYVHRHRTDFAETSAADIIASQEAKAREYGGRLLWQDELPDLPILVAQFLNEAHSSL